ncbi:MAG: hypothetical protein ACOCY1_00685 [Halovenus sp.]
MTLADESNDAHGEAHQTSPGSVEGNCDGDNADDDAEQAVVTRKYALRRDNSAARSASDSRHRHHVC